jgi:hypothetical protein
MKSLRGLEEREFTDFGRSRILQRVRARGCAVGRYSVPVVGRGSEIWLSLAGSGVTGSACAGADEGMSTNRVGPGALERALIRQVPSASIRLSSARK